MYLNTFNIFPGFVIPNKLSYPNRLFFADLKKFDFVMKKDTEILIKIIGTIEECEIGLIFALSGVIVAIFVRLIRKIKIRGLNEQ
jgi:hypothetical protein